MAAGPALACYTGEFDVQLMCRVRDGDTVSYSLLWERNRKRLVTYLHRMVLSDFIAEELAQEVFLRVYRVRQTYEPNAKFSTWLFRIATRVAINWIRDVRLEKNRESLEAAVGDGMGRQVADFRPTIEEAMLARARRAEIRTAILELPVNQRTAVILHKYRELNYAEIAVRLQCSESAVKSLLFRAYERLRSSLEHFDSASTRCYAEPLRDRSRSTQEK